jgi:lysine-specific histone demethylase 1B
MQTYDVVVVGSGISGLYAAHELKKKGLNVLLVEANRYLGGRMKQITFFSSHPLDIGGEFIHGGGTLLSSLADKHGWKKMKTFTSFPDPSVHNANLPESQCVDYFYLGRERKFLPFNTTDPDVQKLLNLIYHFSDPSYVHKGPDVSLLKYLVDNGAPFRVIGLADAIYAKTWASTIDKLGLKECMREDKKVGDNHNGSDNYILVDSFKVVIDTFSKDLNVLKNWQVKEIDWSGDKIVLTNQKNERVAAGRVIVGTPIPTLRDKDISFVPQVPETKRVAWNNVGMGAGLKVYLRLNKRIWPENMKLVLCGDSFVPQIWFEERPFVPTAHFPTPHYVICGFVTGDQAETMSKMKLNDIVQAFLYQLDCMFGTPEDPTPATTHYEDKMTHNWSKDPFIRCAYTYPTLMPLEQRLEISKPLKDKIFFCGEATAVEHELATLNGALESGLKAANLAYNTLKPKNKL